MRFKQLTTYFLAVKLNKTIIFLTDKLKKLKSRLPKRITTLTLKSQLGKKNKQNNKSHYKSSLSNHKKRELCKLTDKLINTNKTNAFIYTIILFKIISLKYQIITFLCFFKVTIPEYVNWANQKTKEGIKKTPWRQ